MSVPFSSALKDKKSGNIKERKEALEALKKGNAAKAQELFKKAIERDKNRIEKDKENLARNFINLGNAYYFDFKVEEAIKAYDKAIEINPDDYKAWYNKGVALNKLGRHEEAINAVNKATELKKNLKK